MRKKIRKYDEMRMKSGLLRIKSMKKFLNEDEK
jgi:hypothetical protein